MLGIFVQSGLAFRLPRASSVVVLAFGVGLVACSGKAGGEGGGVAATGCGCSTSPNLQALSCASGDGVPIAGTGSLELAPSGDIALFTQCYSGVGEVPVNHCRAFRWTKAGGTVALVGAGYHVGLADDGAALVVETQAEDARETLLLVGRDGAKTSVPLGSVASLSADGRYVVGFAPQPSLSSPSGAFSPATPLNPNPLARWSLANGLETLAELPDGLLEGMVYDMTPDASVIVAAAYDESYDTDRLATLLYTAEQGLRRLADPPSGKAGTVGFVSRDGSAFAGLATSGVYNDLDDAFYWTNSGGFRNITAANPLGGVAFRQVLSDDGLVLAGTGWPPDAARHRVYRWTAEGLTWLGPDDAASRVADMTADGTLVLGTLIDADQGFIASPGETRRLNDLLERASLDSTGWELKAPLRISDDGNVVFGSALCGGVPTVYRWVLPE